MTSSTQLAFIYTFVASILANSIPTFGAADSRLGVGEAFGGFDFDSFHNFDNLRSIEGNWPGVSGAAGAERFFRRDSGISQNNPLLTLAQKVSSTPQFNGDLGRNGESINKAGGVASGGSTLARRQGGSGITQNNPVVDNTQRILNHPFINGALGQNGQSINEAGGVGSAGSTLARRQNEHITVTETDTETIRKNEVLHHEPERVLIEEPIHHPLLVEEFEPRPFGVLSEDFEIKRLEDEMLASELADTEFDLAARRGRGAHVLGDETALPVEHIGNIPTEEDKFFTNNINTVNNFTPNGISITGVGPNGSGIGNGLGHDVVGHGILGHGVANSVGVHNLSVN